MGIYLTPDCRLYHNKLYTDRDVRQYRIYYLDRLQEEAFYPFENLITYCNKEKISYIILRYGPNNSFAYSDALMRRVEVMKYLKEHLDIDNTYKEAARFNEDDNYIIIYKRTGGFSDPSPEL
jgi:hypothetical protein